MENDFPAGSSAITAPLASHLMINMMDTNDQQLRSILEEISPNMRDIDATRIVWQNDDGKTDDFCSLNSCKKPLGEKKSVYLRERKTGLIAFFHVDCFREIRK